MTPECEHCKKTLKTLFSIQIGNYWLYECEHCGAVVFSEMDTGTGTYRSTIIKKGGE